MASKYVQWPSFVAVAVLLVAESLRGGGPQRHANV